MAGEPIRDLTPLIGPLAAALRAAILTPGVRRVSAEVCPDGPGDAAWLCVEVEQEGIPWSVRLPVDATPQGIERARAGLLEELDRQSRWVHRIAPTVGRPARPGRAEPRIVPADEASP